MKFSMNVSSKTKKTLAMVGTVCALAAFPELAIAASGETVGEAAKRLEGEFTNLKSLLVSVGFFVGVLSVLGALFLFNKEGKQPGQDHGKKGLIALAVGCALLTLPWVIDTGTTTISGDSAKDKIQADSGF